MEKYHDIQYIDNSLVKGKTFQEVQTKNKELADISRKIENCDPVVKDVDSNLTAGERKALETLKNLDDVIIKKADKGNVMVIMDTDFYRDKLVLNDHLNTDCYTKADQDSDTSVYKNLDKLLQKHTKCLTKKEFSHILNDQWQSSNFYVLPKIHKCKEIKEAIAAENKEYVALQAPQSLKGRPIVAGPNCPTKHLSELLDKILKPLVPRLRSYVKDDWDVLSKIPRSVNGQCELLSCDVVSLYTSIPHDLGIQALTYWLDKSRHLIPSRFTNGFVLEAAEFVLKNNYFLFDEQLWLQVVGTAMGTDFAPPYACLTMGFLEETKLEPQLRNHYTDAEVSLILDYFLRYIDDGFIIWRSELDRKRFEEIMNNLHPSIKFTFESGELVELQDGTMVLKLNFLDISILLHPDGSIETDIYYKDTNTHDYLRYDSHHPTHVKNNIPYTLAKKIIVFCSSRFVEKRLEELKTSLLKCKYPLHIIQKGFHNAKLQGPANDPAKTKKPLPFISTYHSDLDSKKILSLSKDLLANLEDERLKNVFSDYSPTLALKQPPNLLRQLSSAKFMTSPGPEKENGLFRCSDNKCKLCKLYIQQCKSFIVADGTEWVIKSHITCHSRYVVYYLVCLSCRRFSKTGKTNNFRKRMNCHISESKSGNTSDLFDQHVHKCAKDPTVEPQFKIYAYFEVAHPKLLIPYEDHLHALNFDSVEKSKVK